MYSIIYVLFVLLYNYQVVQLGTSGGVWSNYQCQVTCKFICKPRYPLLCPDPEQHCVPSLWSLFLNQNHRLAIVWVYGICWILLLYLQYCCSICSCHWNFFILNTEGINIPADQPIIKLKNLEDVVVPTMEIKVIYH